ncbi:MAG: hypothetical protein HYZ44_15225 [Bacteroidetes bacterium]|nr:hypothetical protein [Bacteroidota bacterium]
MAVLLGSCYFSQDQTYFKEVEQKIPVSSISLNGYNNNDTIYLYSNIGFNYNITLGAGNLEKVSALLAGKEVFSSNQSSGQFYLSYPTINTGVYELKVQFVSSSTTGSLASIAGVEKYQIWRKWILKVDLDPPPKPEIIFSDINGFLNLSWKAHDKPNFVSYTIIKDDSKSKKYIVINDRKKTVFIDSAFVGGYRNNITYSLIIQTTLYPQPYFYSDLYYKNFDLEPKFSFSQKDSVGMFNFTPTPYYGALKAYRMVFNNSEIDLSKSDLNGVIAAKVPILFGCQNKVGFRVHSKYDLSNNEVINIDTDPIVKFDVLEGYKDGMWLQYNPTIDKHIGYYYPNLYFYDLNFNLLEKRDLSKLELSLVYFPYSGNYVYHKSDLTHGYYDFVNDKVELTTSSRAFQYFRGTANGLVNYSTDLGKSNGFWTYTTAVQDFRNSQSVYSRIVVSPKQLSTSVYCIVSDDGKYILNEKKEIYEVVGNNVNLLGTLPFSSREAEFRKDRNNEVVIVKSSSIDIYDVRIPGLSRSISLPKPSYGAFYDPATTSYLFYNYTSGEGYIFNIETSSVKWIKICPYGYYKLINGYLFDSSGNYMKVL